MFKYKILNYWNDQDDLYINYIVENTDTEEKANVIDYYNTSDIGCDYNAESEEIIENHLYRLIEKNNGSEFNMPKISEVSPLLRYIYDCVCESESNMCHISEEDWHDIKEEHLFFDDDISNLYSEIIKYNLQDVLTIDADGYKICAYGCLQTKFNDDRDKDSSGYER